MSDHCPEPGRNFGSMRLVASRDIEAGEEILIEYLISNDFWLNPREEHRRILQKTWVFTCQCIGSLTKTSRSSIQNVSRSVARGGQTTQLLSDPHLDNSDAFCNGRSRPRLCVDNLDKYGYSDTRLSKAHVLSRFVSEAKQTCHSCDKLVKRLKSQKAANGQVKSGKT